jgi:hypothetical protein
MGALHTLRTAARRRLQLRREGARAAGTDPAAFLAAWRERLARLPPGLVKRHALVAVPVDRPPWTDTGLELAPGECATIFGAGRAVLSRALDLWTRPQFQLWARVGEAGPIFNGTRDSHSFVAERRGRLWLGSHVPGQWGDPSGRVSTDLRAYRRVRGGLAAAVLVWDAPSIEAGLEALVAAGDVAGLASAELEHRRSEAGPPEGWRYLWLLGRSEIFRAEACDGRSAVACRTEGDVGILQKEVPLPFEPGTRLRWSWRVDALPSELPEDTELSHDYLSLAVELGDGRDVTYTWSRELAPETSYWCPLPTWRDREHHVVVRSGLAGLGRWHAEERDLYADCARLLGPPPARIVRVWLIAVSLFQRRRGQCWYADVELVQGDRVTRVI